MICDTVFENQRVVLSGGSYEGCLFVGCELVVDSDSPKHFVGNRLRDCRWSFEGAAADILHFVAAFSRQKGGERLGLMLAHALGLATARPGGPVH